MAQVWSRSASWNSRRSSTPSTELSRIVVSIVMKTGGRINFKKFFFASLLTFMGFAVLLTDFGFFWLFDFFFLGGGLDYNLNYLETFPHYLGVYNDKVFFVCFCVFKKTVTKSKSVYFCCQFGWVLREEYFPREVKTPTKIAFLLGTEHRPVRHELGSILSALSWGVLVPFWTAVSGSVTRGHQRPSS